MHTLTYAHTLVAAPIMLDLILFAEYFDRVRIQMPTSSKFERVSHPNCVHCIFKCVHAYSSVCMILHAHSCTMQMDTLLSLASLFCKAPAVPKHAPVINALFPQKEALINFLRATAGLPPVDYLTLVCTHTSCLHTLCIHIPSYFACTHFPSVACTHLITLHGCRTTECRWPNKLEFATELAGDALCVCTHLRHVCASPTTPLHAHTCVLNAHTRL